MQCVFSCHIVSGKDKISLLRLVIGLFKHQGKRWTMTVEHPRIILNRNVQKKNLEDLARVVRHKVRVIR